MKRVGWIAGVLWLALFVAAAATVLAETALAGGTDRTPAKASASEDAAKRQLPPSVAVFERIKERRKVALEEFKLSEKQATNIGSLFDKYVEQTKKTTKQYEELRSQNATRIEELRKELGEARRNRNRSQVQRLSAELGRFQWPTGKIMKAMIIFDSMVVKALGDELGEKYRRKVGELDRKWGPPRKPASFSIVLNNLRSLGLSDEQNGERQAILRELSRPLRDAMRGRNRAGVRRIEAEFRQRVLDILTPEQREAYLAVEKKNAEGDD